MDASRKIGIAVFFAVPAIIGGGIVYHFFDSLVPVLVWETILMLIAGAFISR
jgi:hypothetical protein